MQHVSEERCESLRRKLIICFEVKEVDLLTAPIEPGGVFLIVPLQSVDREERLVLPE